MARPAYSGVDALALMDFVISLFFHFSGKSRRFQKHAIPKNRAIFAKLISADVAHIRSRFQYPFAVFNLMFSDLFNFPIIFDLEVIVFDEILLNRPH